MTPTITREREVRWPRRVATPAEAVKYIDATGCCMLFPVTQVPLPSLYAAVTRRDPRAGVFYDRYFEMVWRWKDELPRRRRAFYAKYFRGRGTFISLGQLPSFLAVREAAVAPGEYDRFYAEGRISPDARVIWETLAREGPLATLELRHACHMETTAGNVRYKRAMLDLQRSLIVSHFGSEQETGAWASARFELTCRAFPKQTAAAQSLALPGARANLAAKVLEWRPDATAAQLARLFAWPKEQAVAAHDLAHTRRLKLTGEGRS